MKYSKEQIKELILTDYLDGRLDEAAKKEIDVLISQDPELTEFLNHVKRTADQPFKQADDIQPSEQVWQNIKQQIESSRQVHAHSTPRDIARWLAGLWARPRLSFALGTAMTVLIVILWVGVGRFRNVPVYYDGAQQVEYLMFLAGEDIDEIDMGNGFGTSIENFLL